MGLLTVIAVVQCLLLLAILDALHNIRKTMAVTVQQLIAAGTTLSTAADGLSVKTDGLIAAAEAVVAALQNVTLPPEADAAVAALQASASKATDEQTKVDAEVAKLDTLLPQPAPPATP